VKRGPATGKEAVARLGSWDWGDLEAELDVRGVARTPRLLGEGLCRFVASWFDQAELFRSTVDMARHGFGLGTYRYFAAPLPPEVAELRQALYPPLARIANSWSERLGAGHPYPATLESFLEQCRSAGQDKPTPLLLRYDKGGYNCLHQDLYGPCAFPLQVVVVLDQVGTDYTGGELLLVENHPRAQSRGSAIVVDQGHAVVFPTRHRPVASRRGHYRASVRHGVSPLLSGRRHSLGLIFHDAA
jgi:hypothetical protein